MDGLCEKGKELVDREKREGKRGYSMACRSDQVTPFPPLRVHAGRISESGLRLILVGLAGHLLLRMSKFAHRLSSCWLRSQRHKTVVWWHQLSSKPCAAFNSLPLVFLIEEDWRDLGVGNPGSVPHTLLKSTKIGSWIHSAELISTSESWMRISFSLFSNSWKYCNPSPPFFFHIWVTPNKQALPMN